MLPRYPNGEPAMPINCLRDADQARPRSLADEKSREARAVDPFLEIMRRASRRRCGPSAARCRVLRPRPAASSASSRRAAARGDRGAPAGRGCRSGPGRPRPGRDRGPRGGFRRRPPRARAGARSAPPTRDGFRTRRYKTRARERAIRPARRTGERRARGSMRSTGQTAARSRSAK